MARRFMVTFNHAIAVPVNGSAIMTHCLIVEAPLENNEGKELKEIGDKQWNLAHTNSFKAVGLGDGRAFPVALDCQVGGYSTVAFCVELPPEAAH